MQILTDDIPNSYSLHILYQFSYINCTGIVMARGCVLRFELNCRAAGWAGDRLSSHALHFRSTPRYSLNRTPPASIKTTLNSLVIREKKPSELRRSEGCRAMIPIQITQPSLAPGVNPGCDSQISLEFGQNYSNYMYIVYLTVVLAKLYVYVGIPCAEGNRRVFGAIALC